MPCKNSDTITSPPTKSIPTLNIILCQFYTFRDNFSYQPSYQRIAETREKCVPLLMLFSSKALLVGDKRRVVGRPFAKELTSGWDLFNAITLGCDISSSILFPSACL